MTCYTHTYVLHTRKLQLILTQNPHTLKQYAQQAKSLYSVFSCLHCMCMTVCMYTLCALLLMTY